MKRTLWLLLGMMLFSFSEFGAKPALTQSQNRQAMAWFETGLRETDPQKKIAAYTKAGELDPSFVEAWFNLGLAYEETKDYARAAEYIRKAYQIKPDKLKNDFKLKLLYALAKVYNKLGKDEDYEKTLHQAKALAGNHETLAALAFDLGRLLYQQRRYAEALAELKEGRQYVAKDREHYDNLIVVAEKALRLEKLSATAESEKAGGNLNAARALFAQIRAEYPEFKKAAVRIAELDSLLQIETNDAALADLYARAQKYEAEGKPQMAIALYEKLLQQDGVYKDAPARVRNLWQQLEEQQRQTTLESEYATGTAALRVKNWPRAIMAFERILELAPNFREAGKKLVQAQKGLERENVETVMAQYYDDGVAAMKRNDFGLAFTALKKVRQFNPNYREVSKHLAEVEKKLRQPAGETMPARLAPPSAAMTADSLYYDALADMGRKHWANAVVTLEKLQLLQPNHRDATDRLAQARMNLIKAEAAGAAIRSGEGTHATIYIGGTLATLLILVVGFVSLSPMTRARLHEIRGNDAKALIIYENLLSRYPTRVKLYPALAGIYLRQGRRDERAMKIYKTILQLNITTPNHEELNAIVAQNFLTEGRTDTDAIEVLEGALKNERRRQNLI